MQVGDKKIITVLDCAEMECKIKEIHSDKLVINVTKIISPCYPSWTASPPPLGIMTVSNDEIYSIKECV